MAPTFLSFSPTRLSASSGGLDSSLICSFVYCNTFEDLFCVRLEVFRRRGSALKDLIGGRLNTNPANKNRIMKLVEI